MPANSSSFAETKLPHQKNYGGVVFPAVLSPAAVDSGDRAVLTAAVKEEKPWLDALVHKHGAILFRGFDALTTASDFNDVVESFGYEELPYVGGAAPRTNVVGRVFTANESPPDQKISFHHEMAQVPEYPTKLFFFCEVEPASVGETPIVLSHVVYERMKDKFPDFVDKLEKHGVIYTRVLGEEDDPSSPIGRGWKSTFLTTHKSVAEERFLSTLPRCFFFCEVEPASGGETPLVLSHIVYERTKDKHPNFVDKLEKHDLIHTRILGEDDDPSTHIGRGWKSTFLTTHKSVAEERAAKLNMKLEWTDNEVKSTMGPIPAIKYDESRHRKIWFNSMVGAHMSWEDKRNDPKKAMTFRDGNPLPDHIIHDCLEILEDESIAIPWWKGDVLLIDNLAVLHSRKSFTPPHRILASLCK